MSSPLIKKKKKKKSCISPGPHFPSFFLLFFFLLGLLLDQAHFSLSVLSDLAVKVLSAAFSVLNGVLPYGARLSPSSSLRYRIQLQTQKGVHGLAGNLISAL